MELLAILVLIVIAIFVIRLVGKILKFVIGIGLVLLIVYVLASNAEEIFRYW
ncbi:hypothetical protein SAMN05421736_104133 [Evansella caseinilytica]|uniref:Uncharacterized protein n=1 Tax=Evansella caseinilytica TaxID=1503961 RepID=A0A1H3NMF6_9BACI|nr:hypothetical protein [Evansella caseinilytica]SDY90096.1 hypothetical protein SAMN05421736_104133 [Evansella caseinilytica]